MVNGSRLSALIGLSLALVGCPSDPACTRNSECEAGSYCSGGACVTDCTPATVEDDCGVGASCNTFGMCVSPPDAGAVPEDSGDLVDASIFDGGVDAPDLRPACVIAGGTDADGDGYCADDCDDSNGEINPGAAEVCTPSALAARPLDENCDGEVDDACGWYFGEPHFVSRMATRHEQWLSPTVSADGLRVYYTGYGGAASTLLVAERASVALPFSNSVVVPLSQPSDRGTLRRDELEVFFGVCGGGLWRARRSSRAEAFGVAERVMGGENVCDPSLSASGLELFFTQGVAAEGFQVHVMRRETVAAEFGAPERLAISGSSIAQTGAPALAPDGHTLFFSEYPTGRLYIAHRAEEAGAAFTLVREVVELGPRYAVGFSPSGSELFESGGRAAAWDAGLSRIRICRDGPCPLGTLVTCPTGGTRSPDGLHCYWSAPPAVPWGSALSACGDGHLATVHSDAERTAMGGGWIGGYDNNPGIAGLPAVPECNVGVPGCRWAWVTGEPWTYDYWQAGEPSNSGNNEHAVVGGPGPWNDYIGAQPIVPVCESELWPTW